MMMRVTILHAPPPDGDDASATYASRAAEFVTGNEHVKLGHVGRLTVNDDGRGDAEDSLPWRTPGNDDHDEIEESKCNLTLILISCAADGSVDRSVRKVMRKTPKASNITHDAPSAATAPHKSKYAMVALGHARCENSANQMADTIFATVRRFDKLLAESGLFGTSAANSTGCVMAKRLETQVELCGPEMEFDPWLESLLHSATE